MTSKHSLTKKIMSLQQATKIYIQKSWIILSLSSLTSKHSLTKNSKLSKNCILLARLAANIGFYLSITKPSFWPKWSNWYISVHSDLFRSTIQFNFGPFDLIWSISVCWIQFSPFGLLCSISIYLLKNGKRQV